MKRNLKMLLSAGAVIAAGCAAWLGSATAADHNDPPARIGGNIDAADIADLYAWSSASGTLTMVLTFGGPDTPAAGQAGTYDANVLYGIHIDNNGDNTDHTTTPPQRRIAQPTPHGLRPWQPTEGCVCVRPRRSPTGPTTLQR